MYLTTFNDLNSHLAKLLQLTSPNPNELLSLYLVMTKFITSSVVVWEEGIHLRCQPYTRRGWFVLPINREVGIYISVSNKEVTTIFSSIHDVNDDHWPIASTNSSLTQHVGQIIKMVNWALEVQPLLCPKRCDNDSSSSGLHFRTYATVIDQWTYIPLSPPRLFIIKSATNEWEGVRLIQRGPDA